MLPNSMVMHAVELLGKGQQFVAHGIHPSTRKPYSWYNKAGEALSTLPPFQDVIELTPDQVESIWKSLCEKIVELGGQITNKSKTSGTSVRKLIGHESTLGNPDLIAEALEILPNELPYYDWIKMCAAIKAALGGDEDYYHIFETWCLKYEGYTTPDKTRGVWDSLKDSSLGANYVLDMARVAGFVDTSEFSPEPDDEVGGVGIDHARKRAIEDMFASYVWVEELKRFADTNKRKLLDEKQFNARLTGVGSLVNKNKCAATVFLQDEKRRRTVWNLTYLPGEELFVKEKHGNALNFWCPADLRLPEYVTDEDVALWLELTSHVIPDDKARDIIFDWCAYMLTKPGEKCNWAVLLGSTIQGIGKDMMFQPLIAGLGKANVKYVGPTDIAGGYTDWAANTKLVVVEEMHSFERKETMNKLKAYISAPPEEVRINAKYVPQYQVPNIGAYLFFSNLPNALVLEKEERRFYIYWSYAKPQESEFYSRIVEWYEAGGLAKVVRWLMQRDLTCFDAKGAALSSMKRNRG